MKLFGFAAMLTGFVLVTFEAVRRRRLLASPGLAKSDQRYGIEEFLDGLD